jgi:hypothetical protein
VKNQYFGDVNDYLKYGILRSLVSEGLSLGVCWMLTPNDERRDGSKTDYLSRPGAWRAHDPELFDALVAATRDPSDRRIEHAEGGLLPGARFFGDEVPDARAERATWFERALTSLAGSDVLFFDPDNGLEVKSIPYGAKQSSKFLYRREVGEAWRRGFSLVVFQHFARISRDVFCARCLESLADDTPGSRAMALRTPNVLFLFAIRPEHRAKAEASVRSFEQKWSKRLTARVTLG